MEGGEVIRLFSYILTIPVSELNLSFTQLRKKLILELHCVHIEYAKKSRCTSESKGTQLKSFKLIEQAPIITQPTLNGLQLLGVFHLSRVYLLWSSALMWALKPAKFV